MNNIIISTIEKFSLIENGDNIIVALSGGADSVALLHTLISLKEKYNLTIYAAHLNHNIRGEEAKRDESFCKILCRNYNIKLFVKSLNVRELAKQQKISEELCGRNERYSFFAELSAQLNAKIATAHTASDNAETLLFNIARGSSIKGLSAIPPKRDNIIRPLIEVSRTQIEDYCTEHKLDYVTDSTNLSDEYTRNKIRHNVIPQLKSVNTQLENTISRLSESAREISAYIDKQTIIALKGCKTQYGYSCTELLKCDTAILKNAIIILCKKYAGFNPESRHIDLILGIIKNGGAVNLADNCKAVAKQGIFRIFTDDNNSEFVPIKISNNLCFEYNNKTYNVTENNSDTENKNSVSSNILNTNAVFRTRKEGDKFTYPKRNITKPLRKALNENKVPSELRDKLIVLADGNTILWCEKVGYSQQGKDNSAKELYIYIKG